MQLLMFLCWSVGEPWSLSFSQTTPGTAYKKWPRRNVELRATGSRTATGGYFGHCRDFSFRNSSLENISRQKEAKWDVWPVQRVLPIFPCVLAVVACFEEISQDFSPFMVLQMVKTNTRTSGRTSRHNRLCCC